MTYFLPSELDKVLRIQDIEVRATERAPRSSTRRFPRQLPAPIRLAEHQRRPRTLDDDFVALVQHARGEPDPSAATGRVGILLDDRELEPDRVAGEHRALEPDHHL